MDGVDHPCGRIFFLHRTDDRWDDRLGNEITHLMRKGFLPMQTTRGDRLFIGLLSAAYVNLAFVGISGWLAQVLSLEADPSIWFSFVLSMVLLGWIMRKG